MSDNFQIKKLRGSGGYVLALVTDEQQGKGNLGGPDLFLAPIGRLDAEKIKKYSCNTCDKEYDGGPKIEYENPNEEVAEKIKKIEKFNNGIMNCHVILTKEHNEENVEIVAHGKGHDFVAHENADLFERAVITAVDKISIQVKKHHDKIIGR